MDFNTTIFYKFPRLGNTDHFFTWKSLMTDFLSEWKLLKTIQKGPHIPPMEQTNWSEEDKHKVSLEAKAKYILTVSLPDDIYSFVMHCESAKEMWDNLIVLFEGTDETRECKRSVLIKQYELFAYKPGESLTQICERLERLICDLNYHKKRFDNADVLNTFMRSLPPHLKMKSVFIRHSVNFGTDSLRSVYNRLRMWEET